MKVLNKYIIMLSSKLALYCDNNFSYVILGIKHEYIL